MNGGLRMLRRAARKARAPLVAAALIFSGFCTGAFATDQPTVGAPTAQASGGVAKKASDLVVDRLRTTIDALSSPDEEGRGPGTAGLEAAANYIIQGFQEAGLTPAGTGGGWTQEFTPLPVAIANPVAPPQGQAWGAITLKNIVGVLPGTQGGVGVPCLVIGAHYDHLGLSGGPHPGADDNASGVAVLLELAARMREEGPHRNDVVFVAFSGEEEGTLGSHQYVEHPAHLPTGGSTQRVFSLDSTVAMLNFDTVGRMEGKTLYIFGAASAVEFHDLLKGINLGQGLDLKTPDNAPFASDQIPFIQKGVPALQFFTGANPDYHRAGDTPDKINYQGLLSVLSFAKETASFLADREERLSFLPPGAAQAAAMAPSGAAGTPPHRKVSLGTIPDFSQDKGGVLLSGTMPGSPAEKAGFQKGDVLIKLGSVDIDNLADLAAALTGHQPGESVEVVVKRGAEQLSRRVQLVESQRK
jgi:aminopeptidase N